MSANTVPSPGEGGEGVVGNFGARAADDADEGAFARVGKADDTHVGDQFHLKRQTAAYAGLAGFGKVGGLTSGGGKAGVAAAASPALGHQNAVVGAQQVGDQVARLGVKHLGATRHADHDVVALVAVAVFRGTLLAPGGLKQLLLSEV